MILKKIINEDLSTNSAVKILVILSNPNENSLNGKIAEIVLTRLREMKKEVKFFNVADGNFNPLLSKEEQKDRKLKIKELSCHFEALKWAEGLIYIYPTWWSTVPAALKGWLDRVFIDEIAYRAKDGNQIEPLLHIKRTAVITTFGGPVNPPIDGGEVLLTQSIPNGCYTQATPIEILKLFSNFDKNDFFQNVISLVNNFYYPGFFQRNTGSV